MVVIGLETPPRDSMHIGNSSALSHDQVTGELPYTAFPTCVQEKSGQKCFKRTT